jgi:hypothetical protein
MGFLPAFYAAGFLVMVGVGGGLCLAVDRFNKFSGRVFVGVLAFGACSYIGFIVVILALSQLLPWQTLDKRLVAAIYLLAFFGPGMIGSWWLVKAMTPNRPKSSSGMNAANGADSESNASSST